MAKAAWGFALGLTAILGLTAFTWSREAKDRSWKIHVEGYVFDSDRNPLAGVDVGVYLAGKLGSVRGARTEEKTGKYVIDATVGDSYDLSFTMSKYRPRVVQQLAERQMQNISVVMYKKGEKMPAAACHTFLQSVDRLMFLATALEQVERRKFLSNLDNGDWGFGLDPKVLPVEGATSAGKDFLEEERNQIEKRMNRIWPRE